MEPCKYCGGKKFDIYRNRYQYWIERETKKRQVPPGAKDLGFTDTWTHHRFKVIQEAKIKCKKCGLELRLSRCDFCKSPILPDELEIYPGGYNGFIDSVRVHKACHRARYGCGCGASHIGRCPLPAWVFPAIIMAIFLIAAGIIWYIQK